MQTDIETFPANGILPKKETSALAFLSKYPNYDGRGIRIAILDTGVDPGAPGLQKTSDNQHKILDLIDATGAGDVNIATIKEVDAEDCIVGLSERKLKIPKTWSNPSGKYRLGLKAAFDLFPRPLRDRVKKERKEKLWTPSHENALAEAQKRLNEFNANEANKNDKNLDTLLTKENLQAQFDAIKDLDSKLKDCGPVYDCLVWCDNDGTWRACVDTTEQGDLEKCTVLTNYKDSFEYGTFTHYDMLNYSVRIMPEDNILQIVTDSGSHGTHVASIATGYFEDKPELNGIAPGAQIIGIKIGDNRINGMETSYAFVNAFKYVIEHKCHMLNLSFGEPVSFHHLGPALAGFQELIDKHGIVLCISAGNNGPGIETVGAPGGYLNSVISVGAYVSTEMLKAEHSVLGKNLKSMMFTWSSRGPSIDGNHGVSVCAPGGAFAAVPNWTLRGTQLMSGTSMASPNCCGCIALVLSGLLDNNVQFFPYGVKRAIEITALEVDEAIAAGAGLIQVDKAFDYLMKTRDDVLNKVEFELKCGVDSTRGIYLKSPNEVMQTKDYLISVEPKFFSEFKDENKFFRVQQEKISLNMRLALVCEDSWVECPPHLYIVNGSRNFYVRVRANELEEGKFYFSQVKAINLDAEDKPCVFKIPISVVKPFTFKGEKSDYELNFKSVNFRQGQIYRHFITAPSGATHAEINLNYDGSEDRDHAPFFTVQTFTFDNFSSYSDTEKDEYYRLNSYNNFRYVFKCKPNKVVQICICKNWSNIGQVTADYSIKFSGILPSNYPQIRCLSTEPIRVDYKCLNATEECDPNISWKTHIQPLRPSENQIETYRVAYADISSIYQIILTYNFNTVKTSEVCVEVPLLSNYLYESAYQSVYWMLFDSNKRLLCVGDAFPVHYKYKKSIDKGDYVVKLHIRHEKYETLEKLKQLPIYLRHSISNITQDIYDSYADYMKGSKKSPLSHKLIRGNTYTLLFDKLSEDKLPKGVAPGHFLKGELYFYKDAKVNTVDFHEIIYEIVDSAVKSNDSSKSKTDDKKTDEEKMNDALRDLKMTWISKSNDVFSKLKSENEFKDYVPFYLNRIKYLEQQATDAAKNISELYSEMLELSQTALEKINQNDLLCYFGAKKPENDDEKKDMDNQKSWVIDLLCYRGIAIVESSGGDELKQTQLDELKSIYKSLQKWIDINDDKVSKFLLKFHTANKYYGKALKILLKQIDDKPNLKNDKLIMDMLKTLKLDYSIYFFSNDIIMKYPKAYAKF